MLPRKRKHKRFGIRPPSQIRSLDHLRFVRKQGCVGSRSLHVCNGPVQACHVRRGTDGGAGLKPGDNFTIPLCVYLHLYQHEVGEKRFEKEYGINMRKIADALWTRSPARAKIEREGMK